ncbi:MAG: hypothetical protein QG646_3337 [Euryarchaeota archaeon]|nr:hypothetical protein [Euryarchaeota archaeon]
MTLIYPEENSGAGKNKHKRVKKVLAVIFPFAFTVLIIAVFLIGISSAAVSSAAVSTANSSSGNTESVVYGSTHLVVEVSEITPNPARPGEDLFIKVNVENIGDEPAQNVNVGIEELYPFTFKYSTSGIYGSGTNTERTFQIEQIQQRSKVEIDFHFSVDAKADSGDRQLEFTLKDRSGTSLSKRIPIRIEGNPDLVLIGTTILPINGNSGDNISNTISAALTPGQELYLRTVVKNAGNGNAKNVRVTLNLNGSSPLISLEDNVCFFEHLGAGSSENLSFKLLLGSNAEVQPYKIPLRVTASNDAGTFQIDKAQEIGINVLNRAKIDISSLKFDPEVPVKGQSVSMTVRLENVGDGEARFVKAHIEGFEGSGSAGAFIGRLKKNDDAPAVFTFIPEKTGKQAATLVVEYEDDFGNHQLREDLSFNVNSQTGNILPLILGAAIILAAVVFYLKKKGKI